MRKLVLLVTVITIGLFLVSCGGATATQPTTPAAPPPAATTPVVTPPVATTPAATAIDAKALFAANCAMCHGQNRQGLPNLGPDLTPAGHADHSVAEITAIITNGEDGTAMAGFKTRLSSAQIDALAQFVKNTPP